MKRLPTLGELMTEIASLQLRVMELERQQDGLSRLHDTVARLEHFEAQRQRQRLTEPEEPARGQRPQV